MYCKIQQYSFTTTMQSYTVIYS